MRIVLADVIWTHLRADVIWTHIHADTVWSALHAVESWWTRAGHAADIVWTTLGM